MKKIILVRNRNINNESKINPIHNGFRCFRTNKKLLLKLLPILIICLAVFLVFKINIGKKRIKKIKKVTYMKKQLEKVKLKKYLKKILVIILAIILPIILLIILVIKLILIILLASLEWAKKKINIQEN